LKEAHVVVLIPHGSQHPMQWQQRYCKLHHGFLCARCHEYNVKGGYPKEVECVYMHRRLPAIEGWGNPSHIRNAMEKIEKTS
jgi:hypothetical protein